MFLVINALSLCTDNRKGRQIYDVKFSRDDCLANQEDNSRRKGVNLSFSEKIAIFEKSTKKKTATYKVTRGKTLEKIARRTTGAKDLYSLQNQIKPRNSIFIYLFSNEII